MACPGCGAPYEAADKFCSECGTSLKAASGVAAPTSPAMEAPSLVMQAPTRERRLVSVLFADLVGFTTLSENRDPEEVRDLLTRYFDTARRIIGRYGGVVEKFIGDAVMAVWGTPVATEDDSERAVRAALELTQAVSALGEEAGSGGLRARAGVVTGEAAVNLDAEGQGMVAGDIVNTASRVQSVAPPGGVYVDSVTKRSTEAAITYHDAGSFELKGKSEPMQLWRADRVLAGVSGSLRAAGFEAPFVGREREMRLVKELFHSSAEEGRAHLVSATGIAGIGKSRLAWEFEKYIDGLADTFRWHRGRCLSYGEGVTYWALAEMIKMRAGITEEEAPEQALAKLKVVIESHVPDPEERRWVEPRLAQLLNLEQRTSFERDDLFAGWRLFFERMAEVAPTVLVFEDIQWADTSLLDFIEYLLEWSRTHPLFVLTLGRPELSDRRPNWGAGKRNFTSLFLEPLPPKVMDGLLCGLVPGLPEDVRGRIRDRAEGVPLYAVETVRMLLDRGILQRDGDRYAVTGSTESLEVPTTLHALIAARLDALGVDERRLLQDASVAGKSFTKENLAAINGLPESELEPLLGSLVRKELLAIQLDPMSPERGQYSFLQALVKQVSYDTLSKKERKARHLAMAGYLEGGSGYEIDEIVEVVSSHYVEAYEAAPSAPDAQEIKDKAARALIGAGERAASLAASDEAQRYFEQAAALVDDPSRKADLLERAGRMAWTVGRAAEATTQYQAAIALFEDLRMKQDAARVSARLAELVALEGRTQDAIDLLERSFEILSEQEPDEALAFVATTLARTLISLGKENVAAERLESALEITESLWLPELFCRALMYKGFVLQAKGRPVEALGITKYALEVALENDIPSAALRVTTNLAHFMQLKDRYEDAVELCRSGLTLARRVGDRPFEWISLAQETFSLFASGAWDEAVAGSAEIPNWDMRGVVVLSGLMALAPIAVGRGELEKAQRLLEMSDQLGASADLEDQAIYAWASATVWRAEGKLPQALEAAQRAMEIRRQDGLGHEAAKEGFVEAVEAAFALGDLAKVEELLALIEGLRPVEVPQYVSAHVARFRARLFAQQDDDAVEPGFKAAAGLFREIGVPFYLAVTLLEHGEWLTQQGRNPEARPLLQEAHAIFERLKAKPWLDRLLETNLLAPTR